MIPIAYKNGTTDTTEVDQDIFEGWSCSLEKRLLITIAIPHMIKVAVYCMSTLWLPEI